MSIKKSLRIIMIVTSIIPVVIVSLIAHCIMSDRLLQIQKNYLIKTAELNRSGLEAMIETHKTEINMLANDKSLLSLVNGNSDSYLVKSVDKLLTERKELNSYCRAITLYNRDRQPIAGSDEEYMINDGMLNLTLSYLYATKKPAVGVSGFKDGCIEVGYPILDSSGDGDPIGYIVSVLDLAFFDGFLGAITFGDTGHAVLLNHQGYILYHPDKSLIGIKIGSMGLREIVNEYNQGLIPASGAYEHYHGDNNQVYCYSVIPELDWVLLIKQDTSEIRSTTILILVLLLVTCSVLVVFIVIFANIWSRKYTEPIIQLRDAMRTASDGNLSVQSNIKSKNELGELSKNFNKMLHIIRTNYEDLEAMHEELLANEEQLRSNYDHIEYLAYHDTLTSLPNKLAFLDHVNSSLISSDGSNKSHAVFFIDLDNFKTVNDTLGHEYGDALLVHTARILTEITENEMLARAGGDEFLIYKENISSKEEAKEFASRIIDRFMEPIEVGGEYIYLTTSIGIAIYPDNGLTPNALIKNADIAMYKSKDTGKNKYTLFDSKMEDELNRNTHIVDVLRNAIDDNHIYLQYQPLYEIATNTIIGFEALMRIHCDQLGFIEPYEFIPIAEESGFIVELSKWLIREACSFNKKLIDSGIPPKYVSVNISSVQINRPGFFDLLSEILKETGLPPEYLVLELTESTLVSSIVDAAELLNGLQKLGVKISLDDFGTGYSSLNYLTNLPINTLKIDKSFIENICSNEKDAFIAKSIISLAHSLNIRVVAEGVETREQLELLKEMKCDIVQGYVFSKPLHPLAFEDLIKQE
ncbi:MAG: EAL domain-containing protein [Clostridiales bacterium]|nr:EAL domain-containing protein [Clostridiales bacterium]